MRVFESLPRDQYVNLWCLLYFRNIWSSSWKLLLHCYHSLRKHPFLVPSGEERGETDVFAGCCYQCGIGKYFGWAEERQITATACNLKRTTRFFSKVGYVLQCVTMLAQSATKNLQSVKVQGLQNYWNTSTKMPDKIQLPLRVVHQSVALGNNSTKWWTTNFFQWSVFT